MDLNHETAMRLWSKTFGKETKVKDYTGRIIAKGAYNDRKSEFGWNVDHILPQSRGGKTADYNLIICHISTNDEKADKFPAFKANGISFEIIKVENHYEIRKIDRSNKPKKDKQNSKKEEYNLYDSASGVRLYKIFKSYQTKKRFVGTVKIILKGLSGANTALTDFIEEIFIDDDIHFVDKEMNYYSGATIRMLVKNYEMPDNIDVSNMLDKCVLLNTYLSSYFKQLNIISDYSITYRIDAYENRTDFYNDQPIINSFNENIRNGAFLIMFNQSQSPLRINSLVIQNSSAKEKFESDIGWDSNKYFDYNYIYTKLAKNLEKEASGK